MNALYEQFFSDALAAGVISRLDRLQLAGLAVQAWFLTAVFVVSGLILITVTNRLWDKESRIPNP
jgi:hypothetical protein